MPLATPSHFSVYYTLNCFLKLVTFDKTDDHDFKYQYFLALRIDCAIFGTILKI